MNNKCTKKVLCIELAGFLAVLILVWADEFFDLPHLFFGQPETPINVIESVIESAVIAALAVFVLWRMYSLLSRIKHLEGILHMCAGCKKIMDEKGDWVPLENYFYYKSDAKFSHGYCPDCGKAIDEEIAKSRQSV